MAFANDVEAADALQATHARLKAEIGKAIVGQEPIVERLLVSLYCRGHALLVGVPGLAKTLLIGTLARVLDLKFSRIQFTPDLMPSDILGTEILEIDQETGRRYFKFIPGPIFGNVLLADEINRTPPKTQAALLEAMQERKVTVAGETYTLDDPFFVLATQNPIEQEGTYPLPEAQLDRFMFNLFLDYPTLEDEIAIVQRTTGSEGPQPQAILQAAELRAYQELVRRVPVADNVVRYAVRLVDATRTRQADTVAPGSVKDLIAWGAGPRASQTLILGAKAHALIRGKYSPDVEDVQAIAVPSLRHRIVPSFNAEADGITADAIVERLLKEVQY
ncbi:MAG: MoxR family ATPase [Bacteroidia bacterium]|nr:MoxR family ATPase [Bacteroidia bacterium]